MKKGLWAWLLLLCIIVGNAEELKPFYILENEEKTITYSTKLNKKNVECEFKYSTRKPSVTQQPKEAQYQPAQEILEEISKSHICLEKRESYWIYNLCLGSKLSQNAPGQNPDQSYNLGEFSGYSVDQSNRKIKQLYSNGGSCEPYRATREASVEFICGKETRLEVVAEPQTCTYSLSVSSPSVCNHPWFSSSLPVVKDIQLWTLSITEYENEYSCQVQHSGYGDIDPLYFGHFSLEFKNSAPVSKFKARHPHRQLFTSEEVDLVPKGLKTTSNYLHTLSYASIVVPKQD